MTAVLSMSSPLKDCFPSSSPFVAATGAAPRRLELVDVMYGEFVIDESREEGLLIDLIASRAVQRLKTVLQHGISAVVDGMCNGAKVTRYEHSIGAMLLVRRLGATVEEQAAALLHDVAHTALSHVVDLVWEGRVVHEDDKHYYLDRHSSEVALIIRKHGFDPARILDERNFTLLERDAPRLCADRVDYGLRDALAFGVMTLDEVRRVVDGLVNVRGEIVCRDVASARLLSDSYMNADNFAWGDPSHGLLYKFAAATIRRAMLDGQLHFDDLWRQTDEEFWQALVDSPHAEVRKLAARVVPIRAVECASEAPGAVELQIKTRTLDPSVLSNGKAVPLSTLDDEYKRKREDYIARKQGTKYYVATPK